MIGQYVRPTKRHVFCDTACCLLIVSLFSKAPPVVYNSEDHASRVIFHMEYSVYSIGTVLIFLTGATIQVT